MKITLYSPEGYKICQAQELPEHLKQEKNTLWVDITTNEDEGTNLLQEVFKFHPLAIEDTRNQRQRPKIEEYDGYMFIILNTVKTQGEETVFHEVNAFVGHNYLVTVHNASEPLIAEMESRLLRSSSNNALMSSGYLLYTLLDVVVDGYFPVLDDLSDRIETMEENVLSRPEKQLLDQMFRLRRMLSEMWRVVGHQRDMFGLLLHHQNVYKNEALQYYMRDVYDHLIRISDTVNTFRDLLTGMVELYMSAVSNRLNTIVTRLTILTLVIGAMTVISGFYGMNFTHGEAFFPPLDAPWGVMAVLIMMGIVIAVALVMTRLVKWE